MNHEQMVEVLKRHQYPRTQVQFAADLGISASYLSDVYRGRRAASRRILTAIGMVKRAVTSREVRVEYILEKETHDGHSIT